VMRALIVLLIIVLICISGFNYLRVNSLERQVAELQMQLHQQPTGDQSDKDIADATQAIAHAREAIRNMDGSTARGYLDAARARLDKAGKRADEKTRTAVKWLGEQTSELGKRIQEKAGARGG